MKRLFGVALAVVLVAGAVRAETKVELKGVHLCCGQCVKTVGTVLKGIDGVQGKCDQKEKTVTITAPDDKTAQKAVDALAAAGFQGESNNKAVTMKDDSGVKDDTAKPKEDTFEVTGDFDAADLIKALNAAGFHVKVKK